MKKYLSLVLALILALTAVSVALADEPVTLRMATGYNNAKTGLLFDAEVAGDGITLADGKTYNTGDLKPTWVAVEDTLKIKFESVYQGSYSDSASKLGSTWISTMEK